MLGLFWLLIAEGTSAQSPTYFAPYEHFKTCPSLLVLVAERVQRGAVLGRLGQSGNANAPHLHFQVTTAAAFEGSEGLPFVLEQFDQLGAINLAETLDRTTKPALRARAASQHQLPLDGLVLRFP
ncbi:MAG: M23 family metallopeptidase [Cytophagaceae bacterium]|nr:MAG: M23 family metallopeptidase [Cytophagaceae bacterium]